MKNGKDQYEGKKGGLGRLFEGRWDEMWEENCESFSFALFLSLLFFSLFFCGFSLISSRIFPLPQVFLPFLDFSYHSTCFVSY